MQGLGYQVFTSAGAHDLPVLEAITVYFTIGVVGVNLLIDLAYGWLNPRARVA
jgi:peptide/nickel transport system permease protein